jgi:chromosome segregation ATPase
MKFTSLLLPLVLVISTFAVALGEEGEEREERGCNCDETVAVALRAVVEEKDGLFEHVVSLRGELDGCLEDKQHLYGEIENFRKALDQTRTDSAYWERTAGEHQGTAQENGAAVEEKTRYLEEMQAKASGLEAELLAAKEEIKTLSEYSPWKQLQKEIESIWASIVGFFTSLTAKKEEEL